MRRALFAILGLALLMPAPAQAEGVYDYVLYNERTGKCADLPGYGDGVLDGPVSQYTCNATGSDNQLWRPRGDLDGTYTFPNLKGGLCLDLPDYGSVPAGTRVSLYHCATQDDNQKFRFVSRGLGRSWLVHDKSSLCLDVEGPATGGNDARLALWHCSDEDDHFWRFAF